MKTTPRRSRSDSNAAAIRAAQNAALGPINPPDHVALRDGDRPFWNAVITSRARDTWTLIDLCTAGNLARTQADIERLQAELDVAGYVIDEKPNPLAALIETLTRRATALSRALHVHAQATVGRSSNAAKVLALEKSAINFEHDDLIPTLRMVR